jgi:hypothetical protein
MRRSLIRVDRELVTTSAPVSLRILYPLKAKCESEVLEVSSLLAGSPLCCVVAFTKLLAESSVHDVWVEIWPPRWDYFSKRECLGENDFVIIMVPFVSEVDPRSRWLYCRLARGLIGFAAFRSCLTLGL